MILVTSTQMRVYSALAEAGSVVGRLKVRGLAPSTVNHTLCQLSILGVVRLEGGFRTRRLSILIGPEHLQAAPTRDVIASRMAGKCQAERIPVDDGSFIARIRELNLPPPRNIATRCLGTFRPMRPDARAL